MGCILIDNESILKETNSILNDTDSLTEYETGTAWKSSQRSSLRYPWSWMSKHVLYAYVRTCIIIYQLCLKIEIWFTSDHRHNTKYVYYYVYVAHSIGSEKLIVVL